MSTESLYATETRIFAETAIRSGTRDGFCRAMPLIQAAAGKDNRVMETRMNPFRIQTRRRPVHEAWKLRTSHPVGGGFAGWLLGKHLNAGGTLQRLQAPQPSFVQQYLLEDGDLVEFRGCHLTELQISVTERRTVTMECAWIALERTTGGSLEAPVGTFGNDSHITSLQCRGVFQGSALDASDPRTVDGDDIHSAEWIMRRDLDAAQFGPDGLAGRVLIRPWEVIGEITMPAKTITENSDRQKTGSFGLWIGPDGNDLGITSDNVRAFRTTEPLQGEGFREHSLAITFEADTDGVIFTLADAIQT